MPFDVLKSVLLVTDSLAWVLLAKLLDQTFGFATNSVWDGDGMNSTQNILVDIHVVFRVKGSLAAKQLKDKDSKTPKIRAHVVSTVGDDLRERD